MDVAVASISKEQRIGETEDVVEQTSPPPHLTEHEEGSPSQTDHDMEQADWQVPSHSTDNVKTETSPASSPGASESGLHIADGGGSSRGSSMSGDGGGDTGSHGSSVEANTSSNTNRRKRKSIPVKRPSSNDPEEDDESAFHDEDVKKESDQGSKP